MPPVGFEPTVSAGERPQTYALDRAATGTGTGMYYYLYKIISERERERERERCFIQDTCHSDTLYLHEQLCENAWLFIEVSRSPRTKEAWETLT